jgi:DNA-directed RNA polymerase subunit RPC12/RpoP
MDTMQGGKKMTESQLFHHISKGVYGCSWSDPRKEYICVRCNKEILGFRDEESNNNYEATGLCQYCQEVDNGKASKEW